MTQEVPFAKGVGFYLREVRPTDLNGSWYQWFNDEEVTRYQNKHVFPNSREKQSDYLEALGRSKADVVFAIVEDTNHLHIGNVGLHSIDWVHRAAELGIVIGDKSYWKKGIGKQAWHMITDYGFNVLNLHRIYATVMEGNLGSLRSAEAAGFKTDGRVRQMFFKNGKYVDAFYLNVLREEFNALKGRQ